MPYDTGNAVPSTDARDFMDNVQNLDRAVNSQDLTWTDRFGNERKTWSSVEESLEEATSAITALQPQLDAKVELLRQSRFSANDAPILVVFGQSNAYGHGTSGNTATFTRSKMMDRSLLMAAGSDLQSLENSPNLWINQTTAGTANLAVVGSGLGDQSGCYNVATEFAKRWQADATALGLPDLYTIIVAEGSQGMRLGAGSTINHWSPERSETDTASHYWRARKIIRLAMDNLRALGKNPQIIAVHWNQWEAEALDATSAAAALSNLTKIHGGINFEAGHVVPWRVYFPRSSAFPEWAAGALSKVSESIAAFARNNPNVAIIDPLEFSPVYGTVFSGDNLHYTVGAQDFFARLEWQASVSALGNGARAESIHAGLNLLGESVRIRGDFSNAQESKRVAIQSSVPNGSTALSVTPNGTSKVAGVVLYNDSDPDNASYLIVAVSDTAAAIRTSKNGDGDAIGLSIFSDQDGGGIYIDPLGNVQIKKACTAEGYTKLGADAPAIKHKLYTGTTAATAGGFVEIAHSLNSSKILALNLMIDIGGGSFVPQGWDWSGVDNAGGFCGWVTADTAKFRIFNQAATSSGILSKPFKLLVTYQE